MTPLSPKALERQAEADLRFAKQAATAAAQVPTVDVRVFVLGQGWFSNASWELTGDRDQTYTLHRLYLLSCGLGSDRNTSYSIIAQSGRGAGGGCQGHGDQGGRGCKG
jgi:hypothetical protein